MPVLPLVASTMVAPDFSVPARSASRIIESAGRSFTLPAGFMNSAFAQTVAPPSGATRARRTRGVFAIRASASSATRRPFSVTRLDGFWRGGFTLLMLIDRVSDRPLEDDCGDTG